MSVNLNKTYGAVFIGMVVAAALHGVSWLQALYYFTNQNDTWHIKSTVTVVMILDTVHQVLITHTVYTYTILDWGNQGQIQLIVWSLLAEVMFTGLTAFIVQSFLTLRMWRLSGRNIYLTGTSAMLIVGGLVTLIIYVVKASKLKTLASLGEIKAESIAINGIGAVTDLLIATTLCILLYISRTGFKKSDAVIKKLMIFTVETGLIISLCALASLISILVAGGTFIYILFFFFLGRLYTNSLLATLNARKILRASIRPDGMGESVLVSLPGCDKNSKVGQRQSVSMAIDTTHGGCPGRKVCNDNSESAQEST